MNEYLEQNQPSQSQPEGTSSEQNQPQQPQLETIDVEITQEAMEMSQ